MGLRRLVRSVTRPIASAAKSLSDIPGSIESFARNPIDSIGTGIGNLYASPGRALGSDTLTDLGGKVGAIQGGMLGGPNMGKAAGRDTGNERLGQLSGRTAATAAAIAAAIYGGSALMGAGSAGAGAGAGAGMGAGAGSGLSTGGLGLGGSYGGSLGLKAGGSGLGLTAGTGGAASLGAGSAGGATSMSSILGSLGSGAKGVGSFIASPTGALTTLGVADLAMRMNQQNQLNDIADEAARRSDAFNQPQRFPYQNLVNDFFQGNADISDQPYVQANLERAMRQAQAQMAKTGRTGGGGAARELVDYSNEVFNSTALPYLQQLSGMAGFGFAPGNMGGLYGQYASAATGAPFLGLNDLARAIGSQNQTTRPWQFPVYNSQQQMMGMGPGRNFTLD